MRLTPLLRHPLTSYLMILPFLAVGSLSSGADAQGQASDPSLSSLWQPQDCTALALAERQRLEALGEPVTRTHMGQFVASCMEANAADELARLEALVKVYRVELAAINVRINEKAQLIDQQNRVIAQLKRENAELELEILASQERQRQMLKQAEAILRDLTQR